MPNILFPLPCISYEAHTQCMVALFVKIFLLQSFCTIQYITVTVHVKQFMQLELELATEHIQLIIDTAKIHIYSYVAS